MFDRCKYVVFITGKQSWSGETVNTQLYIVCW